MLSLILRKKWQDLRAWAKGQLAAPPYAALLNDNTELDLQGRPGAIVTFVK